MSVVEAPPTQSDTLEPGSRRSLGSYLRDNEIDTRMVGMIGVLLAIWLVFHFLSGGTFITPRNLWNLSVQTSAIAIMATGMVLVIVSRNIDLSVGSMVGTVGMVMAMLQVEWLPPLMGSGNSWIWLATLAIGVVLGALIGAFQGSIIAYVGVPSFIVTLGGLLVWRGFAWLTASGRTIAPMDATFQLLGGGSSGSLGETGSWIVGGVACVGIVALLVMGRRRRRKFGFRLRPTWLDVVLGVLGCAVVLAAVWVMNSYYLPENLAIQYAEEHDIPIPEGGLQIPLGIPYPVLILIGVTLVMSFVTNRLRFGRYVFSLGGNPEAANLAGIKTKRTLVRVFMTMGILVAISARGVDRASQRCGERPWHVERALCHRRCSHWRHIPVGRDRDHSRSHPRRARHAVAAIRHGPHWRRRSRAGRGARSHVGGRGRHRHHLPEAGGPMTMPSQNGGTPLVEMRDMSVSFGGVHAVKDVTIDLHQGEILGLVGGNGAGKSTLIKTLAGAQKADSGDIFINGEPVSITTPRDAKSYGIETIYQTLALADNQDAPSNMFLGRELMTRWGTLDDSAMEDATRKIMARLNPRFQKFKEPVSTLSGGQRQSVAIARAVHFNARILIMDEPTAALGPAETEQVRELMRQLQSEGLGIIMISHDIHDVYDLADRISVMLQGKLVGTVNKDDVTMDEVLAMIIIGKKPEEVTTKELEQLHG